MEKKILGYCLTLHDTCSIAEWFANHSYDARIIVSTNKIESVEESAKDGSFRRIWSLEYDSGTGLYDWGLWPDAPYNPGEEWFASIVATVCGDDAIVYED